MIKINLSLNESKEIKKLLETSQLNELDKKTLHKMISLFLP